jgi:uncharacterized protein (TIGR02246 family)
MTPSKDARAIDRRQGATGSGPEALVEAWARAWNAHDMRAAAALVDPDVDFVTVGGRWLRGRDEFLRHHEAIHQRHLQETTWTTVGSSLRPLHATLVLVHHEWTITGEQDSTGTRRPPRSGIFTWVVTRTGTGWLIAAAHNTNLRSDTSHRLAHRGTP